MHSQLRKFSKTYSRRDVQEPPQKRRRHSFSPPPHTDGSGSGPDISTRVLQPTNANVRKAWVPAKRPKRLVQTQIDLCGPIQKVCKICGMQYVPSNSEDSKMHKDFHNMSMNGTRMSKTFMDAVEPQKLAQGDSGQAIITVGRNDSRVVRSRAQEILHFANVELGALQIEEQSLWGQRILVTMPDEDDDARSVGQVSNQGTTLAKCDRYKMYLSIRGNKCIGLCLAEVITKAHKVIKLDEDVQILQRPSISKSSAIAISTDTDPALLGISRIWTSKVYRGKGVATELLDRAAETFLYGMQIQKEKVAFSQPTESGGRLARKWFNMDHGWHVYVD
ncbi:MAG: hypothetical protein M1820_002678 [Bogoriella megaspora]|nr:MAG: hypothetical protein M1820_002678 [Bogoriella megaspora]